MKRFDENEVDLLSDFRGVVRVIAYDAVRGNQGIGDAWWFGVRGAALLAVNEAAEDDCGSKLLRYFLIDREPESDQAYYSYIDRIVNEEVGKAINRYRREKGGMMIGQFLRLSVKERLERIGEINDSYGFIPPFLDRYWELAVKKCFEFRDKEVSRLEAKTSIKGLAKFYNSDQHSLTGLPLEVRLSVEEFVVKVFRAGMNRSDDLFEFLIRKQSSDS